MKSGDNKFKIGIATSVARRVKEIQTGNPDHVDVVCCRLVVNAAELEKQLHSQYAPLRSGGGSEWFNLSPEDVIDLCVAINTSPGATAAEGLIELPDLLKATQESTSDLSGRLREMQRDVSKLASKTSLNDAEIQERALDVFARCGRVSTSLLQRELRIGYAKAARVVDSLHRQGLVSEGDGVHARRLLV